MGFAEKRFTVLLTTEGTYPFNPGGVSTWCHKLIEGMKEFDFSILSVIDSPFAVQKFKLPANVKRFNAIPLWGTMDSSEHLTWVPFSEILTSKTRTDRKAINKEFMPVFSEILDEVFGISKKPDSFGINLTDMYKYFRKYDYEKTFRDESVYSFYKAKIITGIKHNRFFYSQHGLIPSIEDIEECLGLIYRFLNVVNTLVPETNITHSSAAGFCGISNVIAKNLRRTPYLLTEHGIYMREQYLWMNRADISPFTKYFMLSLAESIVRLNYEYADLICPVCAYNVRWEKRFGVKDEKIKVIYNGVDSNVFIPEESKKEKNKIIVVARIDPLKDIKNFIYSARLILDKLPKVSFEVYGGVSDKQYFKECLILRDSLSLKGKLEFFGHMERPERAYHAGDIIVLPSVSEGFPYSVVEAMMCKKAVVATDVGGVKEAIGAYGLVVPPRNPKELANACIRLMKDAELRERIGEEARKRAYINFSIEKFIYDYRKVYESIRKGGFVYDRQQNA
ncbi:MAG: GT4 family glycosyltransferase PelF [Deltaproteobacteria bacterium]